MHTASTLTARVLRKTERGAESPPAPRLVRLSAIQAFGLPFLFTLALAAFGVLGSVRENPRLLWSFLGAAAVLSAWSAALTGSALSKGRTMALEIVLRKQHYLQACAQGSVLLYWGWHWRQVYDSAHLIAAQLLFAYAFDMLLSWSRRDTYTLGFGPFPVIFSINLFLWFRPDWFYLQFLMVAIGFAAKELIRWDKEPAASGEAPSRGWGPAPLNKEPAASGEAPSRGRQETPPAPSNKDRRRAHIFNPSSFPLALFSLGLLLTGTSDITWGREIANTQFYPPHMYLMLFLVGLPGQYLFGVTTMTLSAVLATYVFGLAYVAVTGIYFFFDSYIPIAVFLGMHLLFTDPSTSPRTELGRIIFGVLYGLSTVLLYQLLGSAGMPTFYDKLLQVPILNLSIKLIDSAARSKVLRAIDPAAIGRWLMPRRRNLAYMSIWAIVFAVMSGAQGVGDSHPGQWLPFWRQACDADRPYACQYLADIEASFCGRGSGWACNESGILQAELGFNRADVVTEIERGCELGFSAACANVDRLIAGLATFESRPPTLEDYPIILRGSKGPITERSPAALHARACEQGWPGACR